MRGKDRSDTMISNQILQDTIDGIKAITRIDLCVMDTEGKPLASTLDAVEEYKEAVLVFAESLAESQALQGYQFFKVFDENQLEYIILVKGETDDVYMVGKMAAFQVQNLLIAYKERFDKDNFIKNLLLDNLLLVDIYNRAKKLHIETEVRRCVFIVETKNDRDNNAFETVRNIFSAKTRDFITAVDEKNIILVKEVKNGEGPHPIKTPKGWLHLAHGVRGCAAGLRYVLYMYMTSLEDPARLIASPAGYFLAPQGEERIGDVSNVLFTNGWIADEDGTVFIYYASSDTRMHVATSTVDKLVDYCLHTPEDGLSSSASVATLSKLIEKNLAVLNQFSLKK